MQYITIKLRNMDAVRDHGCVKCTKNMDGKSVEIIIQILHMEFW